MVGPNLQSAKLLRATAKLLGVHHRKITQCLAKRGKILANPAAGWIEDSQPARSTDITEQVVDLVREFLHSEDASREDNTDKGTVLVGHVVDGVKHITRHTKRKLLGNTVELFAKLTGVNANGVALEAGPHSCWQQIKLLMPGLVGDYRLIQRCARLLPAAPLTSS